MSSSFKPSASDFFVVASFCRLFKLETGSLHGQLAIVHSNKDSKNNSDHESADCLHELLAYNTASCILSLYMDFPLCGMQHVTHTTIFVPVIVVL